MMFKRKSLQNIAPKTSPPEAEDHLVRSLTFLLGKVLHL